MDVAIGQTDANLGKMIGLLTQAAEAGARLIVFPECALTGYCFDSLEEARGFAQPVPGPATEQMSLACGRNESYAVFGMLEADGERVFNAAVLVGPEGVVASYRKVHLPFLGIDRFATPGDRPFAVHEIGQDLGLPSGGVRMGMNICYDASFPESARSLSLLGADLIVLPTNWPPGAEATPASVINARALENAVYFMAVNRVGTERGYTFIGQSQICSPDGMRVATASWTAEEILYAEIEPERSRRKYIVRIPDQHEVDRMADRRPEMYASLTETHRLTTPHRRDRTTTTVEKKT